MNPKNIVIVQPAGGVRKCRTVRRVKIKEILQNTNVRSVSSSPLIFEHFSSRD